MLEFKSAAVSVPSGVPKGAGHLSPLLFLLFVNGIKNAVSRCKFLMFANELKLFRRVESETDCIAPQNEMDALFQMKIDHPLHNYRLVLHA